MDEKMVEKKVFRALTRLESARIKVWKGAAQGMNTRDGNIWFYAGMDEVDEAIEILEALEDELCRLMEAEQG